MNKHIGKEQYYTMHCTRKITDTIHWVGGSDRRLALFENLFPIPRGVAYNSYLIMDEKTALIDTVDASISRQFLENIYHVLDGRTLDYLVVNHMEPDHCANIDELMLRFPNLTLVGNAKTFNLIRQFYVSGGQNFNRQGRGFSGPGKSQAYLLLRPHGPLARGYDGL